jgi:hypothetical protein
MLAMRHENISGIPDMVEELCVGIVHKEHMDLQTQEERYGLEILTVHIPISMRRVNHHSWIFH